YAYFDRSSQGEAAKAAGSGAWMLASGQMPLRKPRVAGIVIAWLFCAFTTPLTVMFSESHGASPLVTLRWTMLLGTLLVSCGTAASGGAIVGDEVELVWV